MTSSNHFTRGGQLSMHRLRMLQQVARITLALMLFTTLTVSISKTVYEVPSYYFYLFKEYYHGQFLLGFVTKPEDVKKATQKIIHPEGHTTEEYSSNIVKNPWVIYAVNLIKHKAWHNTIIGLWAGGVVGLLAMIFFVYRGRKHSQERQERGTSLVPVKQLKKMIKRKKQASDLHLDELPLIKGKETSHTLITGTTGSGKSNAFHTLLPQIRSRGDRAIVVDLTGDFIDRYYRPNIDIILNPFDKRHQPWSPWQECETEAHYDTFAQAMIPSGQMSDSFWENTGRIILATAMRQFKEQGYLSTQALHQLLTKGSIEDYQEFLKVQKRQHSPAKRVIKPPPPFAQPSQPICKD